MANNRDLVVKNMLETAQKAAEDLRKEQGLLARFMSWLEVRSQRKHDLHVQQMKAHSLEQVRARCRSDVHDFQNWKPVKVTAIYAQGSSPENSLPVYRKQDWEARCIHCGKPEIISKNIS